MNWKQFLTEKVLKECWHEWVHITPEGRDEYYDYNICKKCKEMWSGLNYKNNRTFTTEADMMKLYRQIEKDEKWEDFFWDFAFQRKPENYGLRESETTAWLFCLDGTGYEEKCKMVGEFYGWEGKMILNEEKRKEFNEVCEPVIKWLNDNCHPHIVVQIDCSSAKLFEGVCAFVTDKFIKG